MRFTKELMLNYIDDFIDEEIMDEKSKATQVKYKNVVTSFVNYFNKDQVGKDDFIEYKEMLMKKYAIKTINNYIIIINKFIKYVEMNEKGIWEEKNIKKYDSKLCLKPIKEQEKTNIENVIDPQDFKRLLRMAKKQGQMDMYYIMKIFAYTGVRLSELEYFTVENIENGKQYIKVYNKGKIREVPLRSDLRRELLKYAKKQGIETGTLFPGYKNDGTMLTEKTIQNRLKRLCGMCRGIKLEKAHPHAFRHMFAIQWVHTNGQASLSELSKILGHSDVKTTAIYTNTSQKEKKRKVEAIRY
ncbi:site-specific integrase [Coprobacillus sp. AF33-1AC]|uniref:tyrosine-type recombinase/integrase n=1 Tax=Coprobacillus sp. AF33-1AC TaxID=2292032 RepID=UPI000E53595F|nr:site-specific integrase [Coprobacillus sp. AF33-1AC]RHM59677.1 site-specific integrase [Coprobacillus sp. AF33-1AC]